MLAALEPTRISGLFSTLSAKEQGTPEIRIARHRRHFENLEFFPTAFAELTFRLRAPGEIFSEHVQSGDARLVFFPAFGHATIIPRAADIARRRPP